MKIFNSLTRKKEEFQPIEEGKVRMYACGPTVYNYIHVGNARPLIVFDVLRRYLEHKGFDVHFVQNFTDIDDKIIKRANEEGISSSEVAVKYTTEYFIDAEGLGVLPATVHPKATESIPDIIALVQKLIDNGFAYEAGGDVYFRTDKFKEYGKLSRQPLEDLESGARVDINDNKEAAMDFALWKAAKPGEPYWPSPWGDGRPGWHIECSAMSVRHLGTTIDIHCGGQDLIFPHHENEIAQSEAANGCRFVNYWMHNGFLSIDNKKMSKSLNNFFTVREAAKSYGYETIRMFMLSAHYRSPLNYSEESLLQAKAALQRLYTTDEHLAFLSNNALSEKITEEESEFLLSLSAYKERFEQAMDDDLNTADAVSVIFELVRAINSGCSPEKNPSSEFAALCRARLRDLTNILGLLYSRENSEDLAAEVETLIEARQQARAERNYAEADRIRDQLKEMGIILEDTHQGIKWKRA
ncbi:MAG: cysteine--tRNA ligase [Clostridiales bacterium]|nr:cysteine--tRNA ligase [Clostridiales bacterium]